MVKKKLKYLDLIHDLKNLHTIAHVKPHKCL